MDNKIEPQINGLDTNKPQADKTQADKLQARLPGQVSGQVLGQMPTQISTQMPGQMPGQMLGQRAEKELIPIVSPSHEEQGLGKTFLVGLLVGATLLFCGGLFLFWALPHFGSSFISPSVSRFILLLVSILACLALLFCGAVATGLVLGIKLPFMHRLRGIMNWLLFPMMRFLGILLRIPKSRVRLAFIRINNELSRSSGVSCKPEELLILLPHCIQKSSCKHRLTHNIQNCVRCGACTVGALLNLGDKYGVDVTIVPGGTVARQIIKQKRPKCVIAVACHRDLTSGVRDVAALPVYGVVNQRPFGPCVNTSVDADKVEEAIKMFLQK